MKHRMNSQSGFTLVELLIVVIILGILAAVAIPQFTNSSDDARLSTLDTSLAELRNAVELYYHQHNSAYPGAKNQTTGLDVAAAAEAAAAFSAQMTLYSAVTGVTSNTKDATHKYGPYLKRQIPKNPYNDLSTIQCDIATTDITSIASDGTTGWKFYVQTGRLVSNDGAHDAN